MDGSDLNCIDELVEPLSGAKIDDAKSADGEELRRSRTKRLASVLSFGSKKIAKDIVVGFETRQKRKKMSSVEVQTDPVTFGTVELDLSDNEKDQKRNLHKLKPVDKGTDPPNFIILNVLPGRPSDEFFAQRDKKKKSAFKTKIEGIVGQMRDENERREIPDPLPNMRALDNKYALMRGDGPSDDIMRITQQRQIN